MSACEIANNMSDNENKIEVSDYCLIEKCDTSNDYIFLFSGANTTIGKFNYYKSFSSWNINKVFLNCPKEQYYHFGIPGVGCDFEETISELKKIIESADNVYTFGCSMGGYGAILYGAFLNADITVAFGASTPLTSEYLEDDRHVHVEQWDFLKNDILSSKGKKYIFHGDTAFNDIASHFVFSDCNNSVSKLYNNVTHAMVVPLSQKINFALLYKMFINKQCNDLSFWFEEYKLSQTDKDQVFALLYSSNLRYNGIVDCHSTLIFYIANKYVSDIKEKKELLFDVLTKRFSIRSILSLSKLGLNDNEVKKLLLIIQFYLSKGLIQNLDFSEKKKIFDIYSENIDRLNLEGKVKKFSHQQVEGYIDTYNGNYISGWCWNKELEVTNVKLYINSSCVNSNQADLYRGDLKSFGKNEGLCAYRLEIDSYDPIIDFNSSLQCVSVSESKYDVDLNNSNFYIKSPWFIGYIDKIDKDKVTGWVIDKNYPLKDIELELRVAGATYPIELNVSRPDLKKMGYKINSGFTFYIKDIEPKLLCNPCSVYVKNRDICIFDSLILGS